MRPAYRIEIDGRDLTAEWGKRLVSLTVTDEAGAKSDALEAEFDDREEKGQSVAAPPVGAEIQIWLGYDPHPHFMGRFRVTEWAKRGPARTLRVTACAAELTSTIRARKTRSWAGKTVGEIVGEIAAKHGLAAVVAPKVAALEIEHIDQQNESDVGFLSRLARRSGAIFKPADGRLLFAEAGSTELADGSPKPVLTLRPVDGSDWEAISQGRGDYKAVKCVYMDHAKGRRVTVTAGVGEPAHRDPRLYATEAEARQAAMAQFGELNRGRVQLEFNGEGRPDVFAEALVQAEGFDPEVDGEFLIKTVRHTFTKEGFVTSIAMESAGSGRDTD